MIGCRSAKRSFAALLVVLTCAATMLVGTAGLPAASAEGRCPATSDPTVFRDVGPGNPHLAAITCLHALGLVQGTGDGVFRPDATATRGQFAMVLHRLLGHAGHTIPEAPHGFADVGERHVARNAIGALGNARIVSGTSAQTFSPDRDVDRAQFASMVARAHERVHGSALPAGPGFPDVVGTVHETNIRRVAGAGLARGFADGTYRPNASLTRAQMATMLMSYLERLASPAEGRVGELRLRRVSGPNRTIVEDAQGVWLATFTDGARTVALAGPARRFDEATASHGVTSGTWVRVLPAPFDGRVDTAWLAHARADRSPDVLATAMEYLTGAPDTYTPAGVLLAGDASYGPLQPDGSRPVGSDWHDFQGVPATYGSSIVAPRPDRYRSVDCSGFMRLLWGVRFGIPMTRSPDGGASLPRSSMQQANEAPGVVPEPNRGTQVTDLERLQPGDLVFFDATPDPDGRIDHVGMYLGRDDAGRYRFISSRRSIDGPTMGDYRGASVLDGTGLYARSFRTTRRL